MSDRLSELLDGDDAQPYRHSHGNGDDVDDDNDEGDNPDRAADNTSFVDDEDEDLKLPAHRRVTPLTMLLCALLLAALAFGAGVLLQKHHDSGLSKSAASGFPGLPGGVGGGAFPGLAGGAGGSGAGTGGQGSGQGTGQGGAAGSSPVVIGTVVSAAATSVTVKDLGGTKHVVHLTKDTTITAPIKRTTIKAGVTVSVYGTEAAGAVSATNITIR